MTISLQARVDIVHWMGQGCSVRQIADRTGLARATVARWMKRYNEEYHVNSKQIPGRPISHTEANASISEFISHNPAASLRQTRNHLDIQLTRESLRIRLKRLNLVSRTGRNCNADLLKPAIRAKRLIWCIDGLREPDENFERRIFVDESTFSTLLNYKHKIWVPKTTRGRVNVFIPKSGRKSVGVFGRMMGDQLLPLYFISGKFNSVQYREVLFIINAQVS